ncbi:Hypothetical_protein [Hexamita inflata]|uniref:Hypothetical_protein n=1 Tax=Hexamita inflata TaxID=28002 RepID=A0AA86TWU6_9EUKA|nr:Hypothetical protein HINF_LOCUS19514 [Hexamita inflata]
MQTSQPDEPTSPHKLLLNKKQRECDWASFKKDVLKNSQMAQIVNGSNDDVQFMRACVEKYKQRCTQAEEENEKTKRQMNSFCENLVQELEQIKYAPNTNTAINKLIAHIKTKDTDQDEIDWKQKYEKGVKNQNEEKLKEQLRVNTQQMQEFISNKNYMKQDEEKLLSMLKINIENQSADSMI